MAAGLVTRTAWADLQAMLTQDLFNIVSNVTQLIKVRSYRTEQIFSSLLHLQELNFANVRFFPSKDGESVQMGSSYDASPPPAYDDVVQEVNRSR